jgi:hypothetical protein
MKPFHARLEEGWREPCAYSSASALQGGPRPTLHSDWNVIAIGPLKMVENASRGPCNHGAFERFQEKLNPVSVRKCDRIREAEQLLFPWKQKLL